MNLAPAIIAMSIGGIMLYSALKGISVTDVFAGKQGDSLNPHGPNIPDEAYGSNQNPAADIPGDLAQGGKWKAPAGGANSFKGPNSALLDTLAGVAQNQFHLTITATTNGNHVFDSDHYAGRAFDASGTEANMRAFSQYVVAHYKGSIKQLIHNPGFAINNGMDVSPLFFAEVWPGHKNHVHLAM